MDDLARLRNLVYALGKHSRDCEGPVEGDCECGALGFRRRYWADADYQRHRSEEKLWSVSTKTEGE